MKFELHLYDYDDNWLRRKGYAVEYCADHGHGTCYKNLPGKLHAGVSSIKEVGAQIELVGRRKGSLRGLLLHTHGAPGYVHLKNGGIAATNVQRLSHVCSRNLMKGAFIAFLGCNVGEGAKGEKFLLAAAKHMLGRVGGTVFATDSVTFSVPYLGQLAPAWSDSAEATITPGGTPSFRRKD